MKTLLLFFSKMGVRGTVVNHNYTRKSYNPRGYKSFEEFYPFYLGEHCDINNRRLHLVGTSFSLLLVVLMITVGPLYLGLVALVQGYGFAWIGHFFFEKNKPATFKHPFYSVRFCKLIDVFGGNYEVWSRNWWIFFSAHGGHALVVGSCHWSEVFLMCYNFEKMGEIC